MKAVTDEILRADSLNGKKWNFEFVNFHCWEHDGTD